MDTDGCKRVRMPPLHKQGAHKQERKERQIWGEETSSPFAFLLLPPPCACAGGANSAKHKQGQQDTGTNKIIVSICLPQVNLLTFLTVYYNLLSIISLFTLSFLSYPPFACAKQPFAVSTAGSRGYGSSAFLSCCRLIRIRTGKSEARKEQ